MCEVNFIIKYDKQTQIILLKQILINLLIKLNAMHIIGKYFD